jgi:Taurine catabolism dioxygenase TauD, TfdA family
MASTRDVKSIPEEQGRLKILSQSQAQCNLDNIIEALKEDNVVLVKNLEADSADYIMHKVASRFDLSDNLEMHTGFASFYGHRQNVGRYFMTVNKRDTYQFITPHSEGNSFINVQIASFYCYENSTDGGESILLNVDDSSSMWELLRESVRRYRLASRPLAAHEVLRIRALYHLNFPADILRDDDQILEERRTEIPGFTVLEVLARLQKTHSRLLNRKVYTLWDSVGSIDFDLAVQYSDLLRQAALLREPANGLELHAMDNAANRHIWHSGVDYSQLFACKITHKMAPGDLLLQNNLTWTHSAANWSPKSGVRRITASFA